MKLKTLSPSVPMMGSQVQPLTSPGWQDDRRLSRKDRGYGPAWDRLRKRILERDGYLCQCARCKAQGILRPATEVDHIIGKAQWRIERGSLSGVDDPKNLQSINTLCHRIKTQGEQRLAYGGQTPGG